MSQGTDITECDSVKNDHLEELNKHKFNIGVSIRYHRRRQSFFEAFDRFTNVFSIILGSTTIYGVIEKSYSNLALFITAIGTLASAFNLVLGSSQKAREHSDLAKKFIELEKQITLNQNLNEKELKEIEAALLTIEVSEPPVLFVLNAICYNEQNRAMGDPNRIKINLLQRVFSHFFDFFGSHLENPGTDKTEHRCTFSSTVIFSILIAIITNLLIIGLMLFAH